MPLAIFDLDNTLIAGDSDYLWGEFLVAKKLVDAEYFKQKNDEFYQDYENGTLDIFAYLEFSLAPLAEHTKDQLNTLHEEFMLEYIRPIMLPQAQALVDEHKAKGDTLLVITATNRFVTEAIVKSFGIENLLAIEIETKDGRYTGKCEGVPSFKEGKVTRLQQWIEQHKVSLEGAYFYSDSHNDLPLLKMVDHPIAVNPDEQLNEVAIENKWKILDLRS